MTSLASPSNNTKQVNTALDYTDHWPSEARQDSLPAYIYAEYEPPYSLRECAARIKSLEFIIIDIDLQIEIREMELRTGSSRHATALDLDKWKTGALRAKQTHYYLLNAYNYWQSMMAPERLDDHPKLDKLMQLLLEDPNDFEAQLRSLLK